MLKSAALAAALALSAAAAEAATLSFAPTPGAAFANPLATSSTGAFFENVTDPGLIPGVRRSPWEGTPLDGSVYSSITGTATYVFGGIKTALRLVWGSPDNYNNLDFYYLGTLVDSVNGTAVAGCCGANVPNSLVTISGIAGGKFDTVVFRSSTAAFEYANVAAVPLPAGGLLLAGAFGALALLRRRKAA